MKHTKPFIILSLCVSSALFAGCSTQAYGATIVAGTANGTNQQISSNTKTSSSVDGDQLIEDSSLDGHIFNFTADGCSVVPTITEQTADGGLVAMTPAPGYENTVSHVTVNYNDDCVFQIAVFNTETGTAVLSDASKADLKEQSSVLVYGDYQDTYHLNASRVVICTYGDAR